MNAGRIAVESLRLLLLPLIGPIEQREEGQRLQDRRDIENNRLLLLTTRQKWPVMVSSSRRIPPGGLSMRPGFVPAKSRVLPSSRKLAQSAQPLIFRGRPEERRRAVAGLDLRKCLKLTSAKPAARRDSLVGDNPERGARAGRRHAGARMRNRAPGGVGRDKRRSPVQSGA